MDKMLDVVARGEMERMGGVRFLPMEAAAAVGLLRAVMLGEDDLLRINLDKDDMMTIVIHNVDTRLFVILLVP